MAYCTQYGKECIYNLCSANNNWKTCPSLVEPPDVGESVLVTGYVRFWEKISSEHDCKSYEFVAIEAWNAAMSYAAESCMIISEKAGANEDDYGADRAEDCADTIKELKVRSI